MDKRVINEEQFRKLVVKEAKKFISESVEGIKKENKRVISFDKVESLIKEMEEVNKSITAINLDVKEKVIKKEVVEELREIKNKPNRDLNVNEHNNKKNIKHVNEGEKDKWNRMLNYKVPSDDER